VNHYRCYVFSVISDIHLQYKILWKYTDSTLIRVHLSVLYKYIYKSMLNRLCIGYLSVSDTYEIPLCAGYLADKYQWSIDTNKYEIIRYVSRYVLVTLWVRPSSPEPVVTREGGRRERISRRNRPGRMPAPALTAVPAGPAPVAIAAFFTPCAFGGGQSCCCCVDPLRV